VPLLSNAELARIFREIGDLVELRGDVVYKAVAYRRAADAIGHATVDVARAYRDGAPPKLAGVGTAIAKKLEELALTGRLGFHERLREEVPIGLLDVIAIPGLGPRTVRELHQSLGVRSVEDLEAAARAGALRGLRGMTSRTEERVLEGIEALANRSPRMHLGRAAAHVASLAAAIEAFPSVRSVTPAGSFRRRRETIGDLDLLVETDDPSGVVAGFVSLGPVARVLASGREKASIELDDGVQVDLMTFPPGAGGTYLVHFTGSKEHNVRLRGMARDRGWSLSEKGYLRLGPDGRPLDGPGAELRTFPSEAEAYAFLGLPFVPPELREDRGEVDAAIGDRLPVLIERADLQGDCHTHTDWSDGVHDVERMAVAARALGYAFLVISDHSFGLGIARGLTPDRAAEQRTMIDGLNARFAAEEAAGAVPGESHPDGFRLLHGSEVEIRSDGSLDFDDDVLSRFDLVVAALHQGRRQSREQLTRRVLAAIRHPHVHVIAHPAGRMLLDRPDLDLDWEVVYAEAARTGTALEIDGSDHRLDLDDVRARRARDAGCVLAIDSDAHRIDELGAIGWGVDVARRAWLRREDVVNAMPREALLDWSRGKPHRV
jgi:DNA polymerase (family X)